ncbi:MAG: type II secretion system protein [Planctomycetes bacterium]|nr:type II secretion system protein [Planctomycetota bacterium]
MSRASSRSGVTLLELMVVIGVTGLLLAILVVGIMYAISLMEEKATRATLVMVKDGLQRYQARTQTFADPGVGRNVPTTSITNPANPTASALINTVTADKYEQLYLFLTSTQYTPTGSKEPLVSTSDAAKAARMVGLHARLVFADAWNKEIEYWNPTAYPNKGPLLAVRSAGPTGIFDTDDPTAGTYSGDDMEEVVAQGRWP